MESNISNTSPNYWGALLVMLANDSCIVCICKGSGLGNFPNVYTKQNSLAAGRSRTKHNSPQLYKNQVLWTVVYPFLRN